MTAVRRSLDPFAITVMVMLCACWGMQQVAIKVAAASIGPVMQLAVRSTIATLLVGGLMLWRGGSFSLRDGTFWPGIAAGALFALEFLCVSVGLTYTTASHMVVFLYTAPIFTVLGLHWFVPGERLRPAQWAGVLVAFAGIAVAFANGFSSDTGRWQQIVLGDGLGILAGIFWAATTLVIRGSSLSEAPATKTLLYQLSVSAVLLLLIAAGLGQSAIVSMTGIAWMSLFFQAVIIAFASFLAWFWMLRRYLASRLSVFSFLTPLFGVSFGVLLLNDPVAPGFVIGAALVLSGIVMVNLRRN